jgi:hypothetical protein
MRGLIAIAFMGACTFTPGSTGGVGDPGGGGGGTGGGGGGGSAPDAGTVVNRPACDVTDSSIQLCLDFDTSQLGLDSSAGQHDATIASAAAIMRAPSEQAIKVDMTSSIQVDETPALDITDAITYEEWLDPQNRPPMSEFYSTLDNSGQYTIEFESDGRARCYIAGHYIDSANPLPMGWSHVACTYDRQNIVIYINGDVSACFQSTTQIPTSGTTGTRIGKAFVGSIDNVHIFSRAVSPSEVCSHAGHSDCSTSCGNGGIDLGIGGLGGHGGGH